MPRARSNPEAIATVHYDAVTQFGMAISYGDDMRLVPTQTEFVYVIEHKDAGGRRIGQTVENIPLGDIPQAVKKDLKALFAKVLAHAESKGHIGAGADDNDLP